MTTIAYRDGVLVCDSRAINSNGFILSDVFRKFGRFSDGCAWVGAGEVGKITAYVNAVNAGRETPDLGWNSTLVLMSPFGELKHVGPSGETNLDPSQFYAFGSGAQAALGAMYMGATAKDAVKIAARIDPNTGGRIVKVRAGKAQS